MLINEKILACRISEVSNSCFKVSFFDGTVKTCFFEDLPYLETGENLRTGDIIKVKISGNTIIPFLSRPRHSSTFHSAPTDLRRNKKMDLMSVFDFTPLKEQLSDQVQRELARQLKEL